MVWRTARYTVVLENSFVERKKKGHYEAFKVDVFRQAELILDGVVSLLRDLPERLFI